MFWEAKSRIQLFQFVVHFIHCDSLLWQLTIRFSLSHDSWNLQFPIKTWQPVLEITVHHQTKFGLWSDTMSKCVIITFSIHLGLKFVTNTVANVANISQAFCSFRNIIDSEISVLLKHSTWGLYDLCCRSLCKRDYAFIAYTNQIIATLMSIKNDKMSD